MITEREYSDISDYVYLADSKSKNYDFNLKEGKIKEIEDVEYEILKVEDNTSNGMQAMAVAPVKNGKVDTSEVVVAFAGTNLTDPNDLKTDIINIGFSHKHSLEPFKKEAEVALKMAIPTTRFFMKPTAEAIPSQIITGEKFTDEIIKDYPDAVIKTTGHSLGGYIALYIAAEYGLNSTVYNAPDPHHILSKEAKDWIEKNPDELINFRNKADKIGNIRGNGTGAEILVDMEMGFRETLEAHKLASWPFDTDGKIIINDIPKNKEARQKYAEIQMNNEMANLSLLADKLKASGGDLSGSEEIFLDNSEALLTVEYASKSMEIMLQSVLKIYQDAIIEAEEIWEEGLQFAGNISTQLSYGEILEALAAGGADKYSVVFEPTAYYREKISVALEIATDFNRLASEIKVSIEELERADKDLANQIRQGA